MARKHPVPREHSPTGQPCLWMSAGVLTYKLCEHRYDCEHCPLDAALRGAATPVRPLFDAGDTAPATLEFPPDRRYSSGHLWVKYHAEKGSGARVGLDAMAANLVGPVRAVRALGRDRVARGETFLEIDSSWGTISVAAPVDATTAVPNPGLSRHPERLVQDPYGTGWILDLHRLSDDGESELMNDGEARENARLDLRHFRRRVALELLRGLDAVGPALPDGGEALTDLRLMLGPRRYLELVRHLVH